MSEIQSSCRMNCSGGVTGAPCCGRGLVWRPGAHIPRNAPRDGLPGASPAAGGRVLVWEMLPVSRQGSGGRRGACGSAGRCVPWQVGPSAGLGEPRDACPAGAAPGSAPARLRPPIDNARGRVVELGQQHSRRRRSVTPAARDDQQDGKAQDHDPHQEGDLHTPIGPRRGGGTRNGRTERFHRRGRR